MELSALKQETSRLKEALNLDENLIGISFNEHPQGDLKEKLSVCGALLKASGGEIVTLSEDNCICPGGLSHLGFEEGGTTPEMMKMLVEGEKLWSSVVAAQRVFNRQEKKLASPPSDFGPYLNLVPISKINYIPDMILSICNATQASRFVSLSTFQDGYDSPMEVGGSMCWSGITYPLVTGEFNITMGDYTARRTMDWDPGKLIVSMPRTRYQMILESLDDCIAGFAEPSPQFKGLLEKIEDTI